MLKSVSLWLWSPLFGYRRLGVFCGDSSFDAQFFARNPKRYPEIEGLVHLEVMQYLHGWNFSFSDYSDYLAPRVSCPCWCPGVSSFRFFVGSPIGFEISVFVGCRLSEGGIFDNAALCAFACSEPLVKQPNIKE